MHPLCPTPSSGIPALRRALARLPEDSRRPSQAMRSAAGLFTGCSLKALSPGSAAPHTLQPQARAALFPLVLRARSQSMMRENPRDLHQRIRVRTGRPPAYVAPCVPIRPSQQTRIRHFDRPACPQGPHSEVAAVIGKSESDMRSTGSMGTQWPFGLLANDAAPAAYGHSICSRSIACEKPVSK